jgi:hypothetical protein
MAFWNQTLQVSVLVVGASNIMVHGSLFVELGSHIISVLHVSCKGFQHHATFVCIISNLERVSGIVVYLCSTCSMGF